jgi:hypothetical protein
MACSFSNFEESNTKFVVNTPRSLKACKQEGVLPQELTFKPMEAFQEKSLSPRLVKLRFDFFEAKRRDLLAAARRAHESIVAEEKRERESSNQQLDLIAKESGLSKANVLAINSGRLAMERERLQRAQEGQRNWLKNALNIELKQLKKIEEDNGAMLSEAKADMEKEQEKSKRLKEQNDRREAEQERKHAEMEARLKLEKQIAKAEFEKQQQELDRKRALESQKQQEAYERQLRNMEEKKQHEIEKQEKREASFREVEAKKAEMRAQDLRRMDILEEQKQAFQVSLHGKKDARDKRVYEGIQRNMEVEEKRRQEFEERQQIEQQREERLMQMRAMEQEENAKKSFQTLMRRQVIKEDASRKNEERRSAILEQQEETELRLLEHEQKKERYLDFKRELDGLRTKNKEINVGRQRRREEATRESVAEQVKRKDEKIDHMNVEKERLWQIRRAQQAEAYRAREVVKEEILKQRIASKYNSKALESKLGTMKVLQSSSSLPSLRSVNSTSQTAGLSN